MMYALYMIHSPDQDLQSMTLHSQNTKNETKKKKKLFPQQINSNAPTAANSHNVQKHMNYTQFWDGELDEYTQLLPNLMMFLIFWMKRMRDDGNQILRELFQSRVFMMY